MRFAGIAVALAVLSLASACAKETAKAPSATASAPAQAPAAAPAPAPTPAPAPVPAPVAKPAEPVWPDPLPAGWKLLDDFEGADAKKDLWGGYAGTWAFRSGACKVELEREGGSQRQKVTFSLPMGDSQCGTLQQLAGDKGKPKPVDISAYDRVVFLMKSGDGEPHVVRFEITELDPHDAALQGYTGELKVTASKEWERFEVKLDKVLHPFFDRRKGRQVGLRFDRKDQPTASGVVLLDNVAFVEKGR
jgi:hypothetical protein